MLLPTAKDVLNAPNSAPGRVLCALRHGPIPVEEIGTRARVPYREAVAAADLLLQLNLAWRDGDALHYCAPAEPKLDPLALVREAMMLSTEPMTVGELARATDLDDWAVRAIIGKIEGCKLVRSRKDRRANRYRLTPAKETQA